MYKIKKKTSKQLCKLFLKNTDWKWIKRFLKDKLFCTKEYKELAKTFLLLSDKDEKKVKPKTVNVTDHARFRFHERFDRKWYNLKLLIDDVTKWWKSVKLVKNNRYLVLWSLWKYIIAKDFYIITMFPKW